MSNNLPIETYLDKKTELEKAVFLAGKKLINFFTPYLADQQRYQNELGILKKIKEENHPAFIFDLKAEEIILQTLPTNLNIAIYSEESGWHDTENYDYLAITDPICNSFFSARGWRWISSALTVFNRRAQLVSGFVIDFNTLELFYAHQTGVDRIKLTKDKKITFEPAVLSTRTKPNDILVSIALNRAERVQVIAQKQKFLQQVKLFSPVGGNISWARMLAGGLEAYMAPTLGTRGHELAAGALLTKIGGIIINPDGSSFSFSDMITKLLTDHTHRFPFIASANQKVKEFLLPLL